MKNIKYKLAINFYLTIILFLSLGYPLGHVLAVTTVGTDISTDGSLTANGALQFTSGAANNYILSTDSSGNATWISVGSALSNAALGVGGANGIAPLDVSSQVPMSNLPVGVPGGIATLDGDGLVPTAQLPSIAITNTYVVSDEPSMLVLSAHQGDVAVRTDINETFILSTNDPTTLSDWIQVLSPTGGTLLASNNLSDLTSSSTARANLGLGNVANADTTNASNITSGTLDLTRITAGSNGDVLTTSGGAVTWASPSAVVETDPYSIHLNQTTAQTFTAGAVAGSGLLKVTSGLLGVDTNAYIISPANVAGVLTNNGLGTLSWSPASGATSFIALSDVPSTYSGRATGDLLRINATTNGLEFFTPSYLTSFAGLTSGNVTTALGFTPYNATNPSNYIAGVVTESPLSGAGTSASHLTVDLSSKQNATTNLTSLSGLTWSSGSPFVKMTAAGTFALDTNTYLTSYTETDPLAVLKATYTTNGDLIYGTGAGTYTRLGASSDGKVLILASGVPSWQTPATMPAGTTNNSTLRYNTGTSTWQENTSLLASSAGALQIGAGTAITKHLSATSSPNLSALDGSCTTTTITVTGVAVGDTAIATPTPNAGASNGVEDVTDISWTAYVSAANTVTVTVCDIFTAGGGIDPAAQTWRADVWQH